MNTYTQIFITKENHMKSWNKIVLFSLLLCIGAFSLSCSDDKDPVHGPDGPSGDVYLSFRLNTDPAGVTITRADTDPGTPEERKVSEVYMLLYESGGSTAKLITKRKINATNGDGSGTFTGADVVTYPAPDESHFVAKAMPLKKGEYQMIILVNPTSTILAKAVENVSTVADMQQVISGASSADYINNGFFMTNAGGVIQILSHQFKESEAAAQEEAISAPVERLLAKILVFENRSKALTEVTSGGTIENVSWGLDVVNKQTYLLRMQDQLKGGAGESGFHSKREDVYAKDPNFTGNKTIIGDDQQKNEHFVSLDPLGSAGFKPWNTYADKNLPEAKEYQYILENTVSAADQNDPDVDPLLYMTHVILKLTIKNPGKSPNQITETDYYSFSYYDGSVLEWRAFTHIQAVDWYNGTFPSDMPSDLLRVAMKEADEDTNSPIQFAKVSGVSPNAPVEYTSKKTSVGTLTFHREGLNIYRIPIMHFGTDQYVIDDTDYGYYGVVRNNTYKLIINSINGPGVNTSNEGYISADITVNPWFERGWGDDLEPERNF